MIYRFRIILDAKEDILRDIEIEASATLEDFHYAIAQAFGFAGSLSSLLPSPLSVFDSAFLGRRQRRSWMKELFRWDRNKLTLFLLQKITT